MNKLIKKKILAIIPARAGSKGIINKNLAKIGNTTLLEKAIHDCKKVNQIDDIIVSTDSKKIAEIAKRNKINVPFYRSFKNSTSKSNIIDALIETIKKTEKYYIKKYEIILLIETTSPLRTSNDINKAISKYIKSGFDFLWTISKINLDYHPNKQLILKKNKIKPFNKKNSTVYQRQQLEYTYRRNGVCYVINKKKLLKNKKLINENTGFLLMDDHHISIDTPEELKYVRSFYNKFFK